MRSSWADSVANAEESAPATAAASAAVANHQNSRPTRSSYVPPHLRGRSPGPPSENHAPGLAPAPAGIPPSGAVQPSGYAAVVGGGSRWAAPPAGGGTGVGVVRLLPSAVYATSLCATPRSHPIPARRPPPVKPRCRQLPSPSRLLLYSSTRRPRRPKQ